MTTGLPGDIAALEWIARSQRPLIVCDVDEVALEFLTPFAKFLNARGMDLLPRSFRLYGNITHIGSGEPISRDDVDNLTNAFFDEQADWQSPVGGCAESLSFLDGMADIVFLTAMPGRYLAQRRTLLDGYAMPYPLVATDNPKGDVLHLVHGDRSTPVVFIDDIFVNLHSVRDRLPNTLLVNLMANDAFRKLAPHPGDDVLQPDNWHEACRHIEQFLAQAGSDPQTTLERRKTSR